MKRLQMATLLLGLFVASATGMVNAQSAGDKPAGTPADTSVTRQQVKMERDEFLKTHRYDSDIDNWVLKASAEPPAGMKPRADVKAERNDFLRNNRWNESSSTWVALKGTPRDMSTLSRKQVRDEIREFNRTHEWDDVTSSWIERPAGALKKHRRSRR